MRFLLTNIVLCSASSLTPDFLSDVFLQPTQILLKSRSEEACVLKIPMPEGYLKLKPVAWRQLNGISACIDPKNDADGVLSQQLLPIEVYPTPDEAVSIEEGHPSKSILGLWDLLGNPSVSQKDGMVSFVCSNNGKTPWDSMDNYLEDAVSFTDLNDLEKQMEFVERLHELEDWGVGRRVIATYQVPTKVRSSVNPIEYKKSIFSFSQKVNGMFPTVEKVEGDARLAALIDVRTARKFANANLARTKQVYEIVFASRDPNRRSFLYAMIYHPNRLMIDPQRVTDLNDSTLEKINNWKQMVLLGLLTYEFDGTWKGMIEILDDHLAALNGTSKDPENDPGSSKGSEHDSN